MFTVMVRVTVYLASVPDTDKRRGEKNRKYKK